MAGKNKYLLPRNGRYFTRIVIPKELRPFLDNKTELRTPLGADRRAAQAQLHTAVAELQARIAVAERRKALANGEAITSGRYPLPADQIALRNYNDRLALDEEIRNSGSPLVSVGVDDGMLVFCAMASPGSSMTPRLKGSSVRGSSFTAASATRPSSPVRMNGACWPAPCVSRSWKRSPAWWSVMKATTPASRKIQC